MKIAKLVIMKTVWNSRPPIRARFCGFQGTDGPLPQALANSCKIASAASLGNGACQTGRPTTM